MIVNKQKRNQYSLFSIILITTNLGFLFNYAECSNKKGCDSNCIHSCPHEKEDVCGSSGQIYANPCILKCCGEPEVDISVCSENGMKRAHTDTQTPIGNNKTEKHDIKKKSNRVPCEIDCYNSCSDDDEPVCGDNGKLFENVCKMDCCEIDEAKMKYCKENGSKRAKIVKVQNIEHWRKINDENEEITKDKTKSSPDRKTTVMPKEKNDEKKKEKRDSLKTNTDTKDSKVNISKRDDNQNQNGNDSINKDKKKIKSLSSLIKRYDFENDQNVTKPKTNGKTLEKAVLRKRENLNSKDMKKV